MGEDGAELGPELAGGRLPDPRPDEVGGNEVGGELHTPEAPADHVGQGPDGQRLGEPRHALEQDVTAAEHRDEDALEHRVLADDDALALPERALEGAPCLGGDVRDGLRLYRRDEVGGVTGERIHGAEATEPPVTST